MTGRERLHCILEGRIPDRIPIFEFLHSRPLYKEVLGYEVEKFNVPDLIKCAEKIGYDFCAVPFGGLNGFGIKRDEITYKDEWGVTYQKNDTAWPTDAPIAFPLKDGSDWEQYVMPNPQNEERLKDICYAVEESKKNNMGILGLVRGPYTCAWMLFGIENFAYLLYDEPEVARDVLEKVTDFSIEGAKKCIASGADAIMFADDYGCCHGPLLSPEHFEEFILPQIKRLCCAVNEMGKKLLMHSDGKIDALLPMIVEAGVSGYHPVERSAGMNLKDLKETYKGKLILMGNVNNKETLITGTIDDVEAEVIQCISQAGYEGGYVICADHSVHDDMPTKNILALYESGRKHGKY